jgi:hypothetical protein
MSIRNLYKAFVYGLFLSTTCFAVEDNTPTFRSDKHYTIRNIATGYYLKDDNGGRFGAYQENATTHGGLVAWTILENRNDVGIGHILTNVNTGRGLRDDSARTPNTATGGANTHGGYVVWDIVRTWTHPGLGQNEFFLKNLTTQRCLYTHPDHRISAALNLPLLNVNEFVNAHLPAGMILANNLVIGGQVSYNGLLVQTQAQGPEHHGSYASWRIEEVSL